MQPLHAIRTDPEIGAAVTEELSWTPELDDTRIKVDVAAGYVTLTGEVDTYSQYCAAKRAALRVRGVRGITDRLTVNPGEPWPFVNDVVADQVRRALKWASNIPPTVTANVVDHTVTLTGTVSWDYERRAAERAIRHLHGIRDVVNNITLTERMPANNTEARVRSALARNALLDAESIRAVVADGKVTLTGTVRSWAERTQAERAAWASPEVTEVKNHIVVNSG